MLERANRKCLEKKEALLIGIIAISPFYKKNGPVTAVMLTAVACCSLSLHSQIHSFLGDFPCFPGADYHPIHWLSRPHLLLLLCLPGGKGCSWWGGQNRLLQLRWRPVVGSGKTFLLVLLWKTDFDVGCAARSRIFFFFLPSKPWLLFEVDVIVIWNAHNETL